MKVRIVPKGSIPRAENLPKRVDPPMIDPEVDEPAFDHAWQEVARLKAEGKLTPIPSKRTASTDKDKANEMAKND